jgi:hypothetical protein
MLHNVLAHGDLAIGDEDDFVVLPHAQNRGAVYRSALLAIGHSEIIAPEGPGTKSAGELKRL